MPRRRLYGLTWLAEQASARVRRTNWGPNNECNTMAEELWTILSRLRDVDAPTVEVPREDGGDPGDGDGLTIEEIERLIRELQPPPVIDPGPDPETTVRSRTFWDRFALPCRVDSFFDGSTDTSQYYNVSLFPFGDMTPLNPSDEPQQTNTGDLSAVGGDFIVVTPALQMQIFNNPDEGQSAEQIPAGTWTIGILLRQYRVRETLRNGAVIGAQLTLQQEAAYIQVPIWL